MDYTKLIMGLSTPELIARGYLVADEYYAPMDVDMDGVAKNNFGEFDENIMASRFNKYNVTKSAIEAMQQISPDSITLVFCSNIKHTIDTCQALIEAGIPSLYVVSPVPKPKEPTYSDSDTDEEVRAKTIAYQLKRENYESYIKSEQETGGTRKERIMAWRRGDVMVMVNAGILTTGFNYPEIQTIVMLRKLVSENLWLQCLGRGSRPANNKYNFRVLDFGKNGLDIGMFNRVREYSLIHKQSVRGGGTPMVKECGAYGKDRLSHRGCGAYVSSGQRVCRYCGYIFEIKMIEQNVKLKPYLDKNGQHVVEKFKRDLEIRESFATFEDINFKELIEYQMESGKSRHWVVRLIHAKHGLKGLIAYSKYMGYKNGWAYGEDKRIGRSGNVRTDNNIRNKGRLFG